MKVKFVSLVQRLVRQGVLGLGGDLLTPPLVFPVNLYGLLLILNELACSSPALFEKKTKTANIECSFTQQCTSRLYAQPPSLMVLINKKVLFKIRKWFPFSNPSSHKVSSTLRRAGLV